MKLRRVKYLAHSIVGALPLGRAPRPPVFVIGTGRCGSSLLVKILNTHPQLVGYVGEANELWHPNSYPFKRRTIETPMMIEDPTEFTARSIQSWSAGHDRYVKRRFDGYHFFNGRQKSFFIKSAMISFMIPKIQEMYPAAKFIHIYRNGPSVVESFLKKDWNKYIGHLKTQDEFRRHCAAYWNACLLEVEAQKQSRPLNNQTLLEFSYEILCDDPAGTLAVLSAFLDITPDQYGFDLTQIQSQNYKVGDYTADEKWRGLLEIMREGMELKGYF